MIGVRQLRFGARLRLVQDAPVDRRRQRRRRERRGVYPGQRLSLGQLPENAPSARSRCACPTSASAASAARPTRSAAAGAASAASVTSCRRSRATERSTSLWLLDDRCRAGARQTTGTALRQTPAQREQSRELLSRDLIVDDVAPCSREIETSLHLARFAKRDLPPESPIATAMASTSCFASVASCFRICSTIGLSSPTTSSAT